MSIPTTPLAPIASLMTSVNRTYQMFLKSLVRQDAGAVAWLLSAAKLLRHDGTEDPLHGRDVMMLAKG
ncbi:hypothetical protein EON65_18535 [archaeon]|nr:MAG: hypothetical protein EON65_18535 [archaeon]